MCQTRPEAVALEDFICNLQGLANEQAEAQNRAALIENALALPMSDRLVLWQRLGEAIVAETTFEVESSAFPAHTVGTTWWLNFTQ